MEVGLAKNTEGRAQSAPKYVTLNKLWIRQCIRQLWAQAPKTVPEPTFSYYSSEYSNEAKTWSGRIDLS